jgi:hypothetical protein
MNYNYFAVNHCNVRHLIPACDVRMHTVPECWCPVRVHGKGTLRQFYEHFSAQEIRDGIHHRRGILK